jgi:hypothetical protein
MQKKGDIRKATSNLVSPILIVKRSNKYRVCVDYRSIMEVLPIDPYPMPLISEIPLRVRSLACFSKINHTEAFYYVRIAEGHQH